MGRKLNESAGDVPRDHQGAPLEYPDFQLVVGPGDAGEPVIHIDDAKRGLISNGLVEIPIRPF